MLPSCSCANVILSLRRIRSFGRTTRSWTDPSSPALREASLRAEPMGLPGGKRACERSPWACPARSEPASGAHGFLLSDTRLLMGSIYAERKDDHVRATEPYRPSRATASLGYGGDLGRLRCDSGHGGRAARQLPDGAGARIARGDFVPAVVLGAQPQPRRRLHHRLAVP